MVEKFVPQMATKGPADFWDEIASLVGDYPVAFTLINGAKAYLRIYPTVAVPPIATELEAVNLARQGGLKPLGEDHGWGFSRNSFGALVCELSQQGQLKYFTQLFLSRELWGVDAVGLNADHIRAQCNRGICRISPPRYIARMGYIEQHFVKTLTSYLNCAQNTLLPAPLQIEAGCVGIKDYSLAIGTANVVGKALRNAICWKSEISSYSSPAWEILRGFFDRIWDNCGLHRTAQAQEELNKIFGRG